MSAAGNLREAWARAKQRRWVRWSVELGLAALVFLAVMGWQTRNLIGGGDPAPAFELRDLEGQIQRHELDVAPVAAPRPAAPASSRPHRVPRPRNRLIGRDDDVQRVSAVVAYLGEREAGRGVSRRRVRCGRSVL